jgi:hypothetical protein
MTWTKLRSYVRRAARHLSATLIPWLALFVVLYAARSMVPDEWSVNAAFIIELGLILRALWRAGRPSLIMTGDGYLILTNPWRTYRLQKEKVEGYTWASPSWVGRDAAPIVAIVDNTKLLRRRQIRIAALSGDEALDAMHALGFKQLAEPEGA